MQRYDYRAAPYRAKTAPPGAIMEYPLAYGPQLAWAIEGQKDSNDWVSEVDHLQGYSDLCKLQWEVIMGANIDRLIVASEATYRLLDNIHNGQSYTASPDPTEPSGYQTLPAIPYVPPTFSPAAAIGTNALRLLVPDMAFRDNERKLQLIEVVSLLQQLAAANNTEALEDIIGKLAAIIAVL